MDSSLTGRDASQPRRAHLIGQFPEEFNDDSRRGVPKTPRKTARPSPSLTDDLPSEAAREHLRRALVTKLLIPKPPNPVLMKKLVDD